MGINPALKVSTGVFPRDLGVVAGALLGHEDELCTEVGPPADGAEDGRVAEHDGEVRRQLHHDDLAPEGVRGAERAPASVSCQLAEKEP